ncbi:serine/threonine-protein kinase [Nocardiopsis algeriensis]|uniref:Protein kinase domain-containing protein n=1 Tax=Nocardiopsis algeriensis TaxID=1478215 RepID=A0A841II75_9ACTN|nr:serine/threonine-protein kinase [Nocardiopsis algeriensis]MBB6118363.1 hypothetical protein [Nocardiopsis algeriensis]
MAVALPATATDLTSTDPAAIGPYRLLKRLGAGGMGVVYAAVDAQGALVAVKLIHAEYSADPEFRARFAREVELLHRVGGACAVPLLAADTGAERPWLTTPLVRGLTLSAYVRENGPLDERLLLGLAAGVAEALVNIHAAGVVHRDLKPANIVLSPEGPRVLDFGVARAADQTAITRTGSVTGSPGWISPAHYQGEAARAADDVFGWGAVMAYAATGRPPFGTGDPAAVAHRVLDGEPDMEEFTGPLADLVRRSLAKRADARPTVLELVRTLASVNSPWDSSGPVRSAEEAAGAMAAVVGHTWQGVRPAPEQEFRVPPPSGRNRKALAVGAVAGALALVAGLGVGGVALAGNWDSLPAAAWFTGEGEEGSAPGQGTGEAEGERPGPGGQEPSESAASSVEPSEEPSEAEEGTEEEPETGGGETVTVSGVVGSGVSASGPRPSGEHVVPFQPAGGTGVYARLDGATVVCAWSFCQDSGVSVSEGSTGTVPSSPSALAVHVSSGNRTVQAEVTYTTDADGTVTITRLVERHSAAGTGTPPW